MSARRANPITHPRTAPSGPPGSTRTVFAALGTVVLLLASAPPAEAQAPPRQADAWEFYLTGGWFLPTGAQRASVKGADLTALVVSYVPRPSFALTGTFQWARSHALAVAGEPKLDIFIWDAGAETRAAPRSLGGAWTVAPFAGIGGGARSYNIPRLPAGPTINLAAYGSAGGEFAIHRVHLRLEVRDYVSRFKPLTGGGKAATRNDVVVILGVRFASNEA